MGTPDFAVPALAALIEAGHEILCAYSQPPRRAGRGQKERVSPVFAYAAENGIAMRTPKRYATKRCKWNSPHLVRMQRLSALTG